MAFNYNVNTGASGLGGAGKIAFKNVSIGFYRQTGLVVAEFDVRGIDWVDDDSYPEAYLIYGGATKKTQVIEASDIWTRKSISWQAGYNSEDGSSLNLADLGEIDIVLRIEDEDNVQSDTTFPVAVNLDPNDEHLTLLTPTIGDDDTPDIIWTLSDLPSEQFMTPTLTAGGSSVTACTFTFDDSTTVTLSTGIMNLNGVKFGDSSLAMNSANAGKAYWKKVSKYKITSPTMASGENAFTINLNCVAV